jgi:hypothetical protein
MKDYSSPTTGGYRGTTDLPPTMTAALNKFEAGNYDTLHGNSEGGGKAFDGVKDPKYAEVSRLWKLHLR